MTDDMTACVLCVSVERGVGAQREVAHRRAAGCSSRARRVSAEGPSPQCGDEPDRREWRHSDFRHRCTLHGEQVGHIKKILISLILISSLVSRCLAHSYPSHNLTSSLKSSDFDQTVSSRYLHERLSQLQEEVNLLKTNLVKYKVRKYLVNSL